MLKIKIFDEDTNEFENLTYGEFDNKIEEFINEHDFVSISVSLYYGHFNNKYRYVTIVYKEESWL